jgi:hypothetical protein
MSIPKEEQKKRACAKAQAHDFYSSIISVSSGFYSSGKPATLVSIDKIPAKREADPTASQLTSPIATLVPMVAIAVCAIVLTARIPAATNQSMFKILFNLFNIIKSPFNPQKYA